MSQTPLTDEAGCWPLLRRQEGAPPDWTVHIVQLTTGRLWGRKQCAWSDGCLLSRQSFHDATVNLYGCTPKDAVSVVMAVDLRFRARFNGILLNNGFWIGGDGDEFDMLLSPGVLVTAMLPKASLYRDMGGLERALAEELVGEGGGEVPVTPGLRRIATEISLGLPRQWDDLPLIHEVRQALWAHRDRNNDSALRSDLRLVREARQYVLENSERPVRVAEICDVLKTSRKRLQFSFHNVLELPPLQYIHIVRLNGVRQALLDGGVKLKVSEAAAAWGFRHLGRFSEEYRRMYGELPSETCRRESVVPNGRVHL